MEIPSKEIKTGNKWVGQFLWICDYRRPDLNKKAIRHQKPTLVIVRVQPEKAEDHIGHSSDNYFVKISAKGVESNTKIALNDSTSSRHSDGVPVKVFDNESECISAYNVLADEIISAFDEKLKNVVEKLEKERQEIVDNKIS